MSPKAKSGGAYSHKGIEVSPSMQAWFCCNEIQLLLLHNLSKHIRWQVCKAYRREEQALMEI